VGTSQQKILCIDNDATLLKCRCAVLSHSGYKTIAATVSQAFQRLRANKFDLVVVHEEQKSLLAALPAETRTLVLDGFIFPTEMLAAVKERLAQPRQGISLVRPLELEDSNVERPRKLSKSTGPGFRAQLAHSTFGRDLFLSLLQRDDPAGRILGQLFDEWVDTGSDDSGEEHPKERRIGKALAACRLLEGYVQQHPPKLSLGDGEHTIRLQQRATPLWVLGSRVALTSYEEDAASGFIQFLGQEWCFEFAKCRECGFRFDMKRSPAQKYQFGIHCAQHQRAQSHKAAIYATKKARHLRQAALLSLGVQAIRSGSEGARPSSQQILERVYRQDGDGAKRLGMTVYWITRNRELIERAARDQPQSSAW
jgi:hypothetical protein